MDGDDDGWPEAADGGDEAGPRLDPSDEERNMTNQTPWSVRVLRFSVTEPLILNLGCRLSLVGWRCAAESAVVAMVEMGLGSPCLA